MHTPDHARRRVLPLTHTTVHARGKQVMGFWVYTLFKYRHSSTFVVEGIGCWAPYVRLHGLLHRCLHLGRNVCEMCRISRLCRWVLAICYPVAHLQAPSTLVDQLIVTRTLVAELRLGALAFLQRPAKLLIVPVVQEVAVSVTIRVAIRLARLLGLLLLLRLLPDPRSRERTRG